MEAQELIPFAKRLATESGCIIRHYFQSDYTVELKEDDSPVTIADRKAEEVMRTLIGQEFPDHGILGEEFGHDKPDAEYQWVLDPIDGTKSFVSHSYLFGTLIALTHHDRPILGVINHPITDDFLVGTGDRTWLNDHPVQVRNCSRVEEAQLVSTYHTEVGKYRDAIAYEQLARRVARYRTWGDCHGYYLIAVGGADIMTDPIMNKWDMMALVPIIQGAGGTITDWYGNDLLLSLGAQGTVATGGSIHQEVIEILGGS
ncbi:inositol monophosphatase family protein [Chloroflexi bacterium TSY]|nr:inositol monophosphatase family protein [Chloroflexi bacterium TSY]